MHALHLLLYNHAIWDESLIPLSACNKNCQFLFFHLSESVSCTFTLQVGFSAYQPAVAGVQVSMSIPPINTDHPKSVPSYKRQTDNKKGKKKN